MAFPEKTYHPGMKNIKTAERFPGICIAREPHAGRMLGKGRVLALPCMVAGVSVLCVAGMLWVTREGDRKDHILKENSSWLPDGPGTVVIEALEDSVFHILQPALPEREQRKESS